MGIFYIYSVVFHRPRVLSQVDLGLRCTRVYALLIFYILFCMNLDDDSYMGSKHVAEQFELK